MLIKKSVYRKGMVFGIFIIFFGLSVIPTINGNILKNNIIFNFHNYEENIDMESTPSQIDKNVYNEDQPYFGSYPNSYEFVYFYHPPKELEWEYNIDYFNGTISKFNLLASDNTYHSWDLSKFELHINGENFSNPDNQTYYRKYGPIYQWEISWENLSKYCNGVILFEIIYLECLWIHYDWDLDDDGDAEFNYSYYNPYSYLNGILDAQYWFDSDKGYKAWYTPHGDPPNIPSKPSGNTSGYICFDHNYSTITTDPDGLNVSYGWDWDGDLIVDEWTEYYGPNETCSIAHEWNDPGNYNISVKAKNGLKLESNWSAQLNVTILNHPPYAPSNPTPADGETNVILNTTICWNGGDPDTCDTVTYNVYFGSTFPLPLVSSNQSDTCYDPGTLEPYSNYYWYVIALDNHGAFNISPIWSFTTAENQPPTSPDIDGKSQGEPGIKYEFTFVSTDPDHHTIKYIIDWGDGNSNETGFYESGEVVTLDHSWDKKGTYNITAVAEDCYLESSEESHFEIIINSKPNSPIINGPHYGKNGVEYEYNFSIFDPDGDLLYLRVDWEVGPGKWDGPFPSDSIIIYNYTWKNEGTYTIRAQVMDINGTASEWGEFTVTMPKYKITIKSVFFKLLDQFPLIQRLINYLLR